MKNNKSNLFLILISLFPILLLLLLFNNLIPNPHTKISGNNGIELNKIEFLFVIIILSFISYVGSISLSKTSIFLTKFNPTFLRFMVNIAFSILLVFLILSNLK